MRFRESVILNEPDTADSRPSTLTERPGNPVTRRRCRSSLRWEDHKTLVFRKSQTIVSIV